MKLEEISNLSNEMLKKLVDCLGFDGDYYTSINRSIIMFANIGVPGKFLTARSKTLKNFLIKLNIDEQKKKVVFNEGLILIDKTYKNNPIDKDLLVTLIHERLHSNRMLLINSQFSENEEINSIFYDNGRFVQNTASDQMYYADASQDIFKGSIDDSMQTIQKYSSISNEEKESLSFADYKYNEKMEQQYIIDEALVETMAIVAYQLHNKQTDDIMGIIKDINENYDADDIKAITSIILRHNDLELFNWMIDPLSYQINYINYDYFKNYITKEDIDDYNTLINSEEIFFFEDDKPKKR